MCDKLGRPLVLFADDDHDILALLKAVAQNQDWEAVTSTTAREILTTVNYLCEEGMCPDIIVADVNYFDNQPGPRITGITAGEQIRKMFPDIPILYLTAYASSLIRGEVRKQGADIMEKPVDIEALIQRIKFMMEYTGHSGYRGPERRKNSINHAGCTRRRTDRKLEMPKFVRDQMKKAAQQKGQ